MAVSAGNGPGEEPYGADIQVVLDALDDPTCRRILRAIGPEALTANECSDACGLALSTTYRKLELLDAAGFVEERLRIRRDGKHASQYRRRFDGLSVEVSEDGTFDLVVTPREPSMATPTAG